MKHLNIEKLRQAVLQNDPCDYVIVPGFLSAVSIQEVMKSYPQIAEAGSYPLDTVDVSPVLQEIIDEMSGSDFETIVAEKFGLETPFFSKIFSLCGFCKNDAGEIYASSDDCMLTVFLYLKEENRSGGGKLRLLRSSTDLDDFSQEISPAEGVLIILRNSDNFFIGRSRFEGIRRWIQMNWMIGEDRKGLDKLKHTLSIGLKKLTAAN